MSLMNIKINNESRSVSLGFNSVASYDVIDQYISQNLSILNFFVGRIQL